MASAPVAWDAEVLPAAKAVEANEGRSMTKLPKVAEIIVIAAVLFACVQVERDNLACVSSPTAWRIKMEREAVDAIRFAQNWKLADVRSNSVQLQARPCQGPKPARADYTIPGVVAAAGGASSSTSAQGGSCGDSGGSGGGRGCPVPGCTFMPKPSRPSTSLTAHWKAQHAMLGPQQEYVPHRQGSMCGECQVEPSGQTASEWRATIADTALEGFTTMKMEHFESQATIQRAKGVMKQVAVVACMPMPYVLLVPIPLL
jgi:hypothetical protein